MWFRVKAAATESRRPTFPLAYRRQCSPPGRPRHGIHRAPAAPPPRPRRAAVTCKVVAGRGLGWFEHWAAGIRVLPVVVSRAPLMAGLMRTSVMSGVGWPARCRRSAARSGRRRPARTLVSELDGELEAFGDVQQAGVDIGVDGATGGGASSPWKKLFFESMML